MAQTTAADRPSRQAAARLLIAGIHASDDPIDSGAVDSALGLRPLAVEAEFTMRSLLARHGAQRFERADLDYRFVRAFYRLIEGEIAKKPALRILDLGSGYGRYAFYGALLRDLPVHGIELLPERVAEAERVRAELGLDTISFGVGDVITAEWPESDCYCMLNAVLPVLIGPVLERLERIARNRRILVASIATSNETFAAVPWLREVPGQDTAPQARRELRLYVSR